MVSPEIWRCEACGFVRQAAAEPLRTESDLPVWMRGIFLALGCEEDGLELLQIGCGDGRVLEQAKALGLTVMGVETCGTRRQQARQRLPGVFIAQSVEDLPPHGFDFVLLTDVLENVVNPYASFYTLYGKNAITARTKVLADIVLKDADMLARNIFSAPALAALFQSLGFPEYEITEVPYPDGTHLHCVAQGSQFAQFMQERYVPGTWSELTDYEHLPRYDYASHLAAGGDVLDFGCGTGYGARRLAGSARKVLAVDIDEAALDYAHSSHAAENLHFMANADLAASLDAASFDLITCFEVIEHVSAKQQVELVKNLAGLLKPEGILLISTPNPSATALYGENPYHLHELKLEEFRSLVSEIFPHVQVFLQNISASVFLQAEDFPGHEKLLYNQKLFAGENKSAIYVAVCAKRTLPALPSVVYPDQKHNFIAAHVEMLRRRNVQSLERMKLVRFQHENAALLSGMRSSEEKVEKLSMQLESSVESQKSLGTQLQLAKEEVKSTLAQSRIEREQLRAAQLQAEHFRLRLEQIEHSTSWRVLRRMQPLLVGLRPILRPPLQLAYRAYRHLHSRPVSPTPLAGPVNPTWQSRNLQLELRLEPAWNEAAGRYELECDQRVPLQNPGGWMQPYHVVPFHRKGPAETRILHIIPNVFVGGSTQLVIDLVQNLPRSYEHAVLTAALWQGGAHTGIEVHHVHTPNPIALAQVLDKVRPHMVHMHYWGLTDESWYQAVLKALRGRGVPVVQNVNTPITPLVDPVFSAYVFVSQYVLDHFGKEAIASGASVRVIHPGIDLSRFEGQDIDPDAQNAIGMVYRLEHDKLNEDSIELLIEAVRRRPRTRAYVIGGGSLLQPYLERTEQAGVRENFRFTGYVHYDSLPRWYEKFRIFIAPVWKESFGQVAPFAMSKGCAVAGYDIGALAEIVGSHETLGHDLDEAAGIIVKLLDDPERLRLIGEANHFRARELFGLPKMIERYTEVYDLVLTRY